MARRFMNTLTTLVTKSVKAHAQLRWTTLTTAARNTQTVMAHNNRWLLWMDASVGCRRIPVRWSRPSSRSHPRQLRKPTSRRYRALRPGQNQIARKPPSQSLEKGGKEARG